MRQGTRPAATARAGSPAATSTTALPSSNPRKNWTPRRANRPTPGTLAALWAARRHKGAAPAATSTAALPRAAAIGVTARSAANGRVNTIGQAASPVRQTGKARLPVPRHGLSITAHGHYGAVVTAATRVGPIDQFVGQGERARRGASNGLL